MSTLFERIEFPIHAVYNCTAKEGVLKCGGTADIGQERKCGGTVFNEEIGFPKYKLTGCSDVSVTTDPKGQPSKFWNWAINGMKGCISSIRFGVENGVYITQETQDAIENQANELQFLLLFNDCVKDGKDGKEVEVDLDPDRFWKWSNFGLLSCLNFFRWGIESEVPITKEELDKVKAEYLRLGQYIESLEDAVVEETCEVSTCPSGVN